jgi:hypothetical protein
MNPVAETNLNPRTKASGAKRSKSATNVQQLAWSIQEQTPAEIQAAPNEAPIISSKTPVKPTMTTNQLLRVFSVFIFESPVRRD